MGCECEEMTLVALNRLFSFLILRIPYLFLHFGVLCLFISFTSSAVLLYPQFYIFDVIMFLFLQ
jgi:hypothetical protein